MGTWHGVVIHWKQSEVDANFVFIDGNRVAILQKPSYDANQIHVIVR